MSAYRHRQAHPVAQRFGDHEVFQISERTLLTSPVAAAVATGCTVLVVPCDVEVEAGERRIFRDSLVGVDLDVLKAL